MFQMLRPSPMGQAKSPQEDLIRALREAFGEATPETLAALIREDGLPREYLKRMATQVIKYPALIGITQEDFLNAVDEARPDLGPLLHTDQGRQWFGKVADSVGTEVPGLLLRGIFGG